MKLSRLDYIIRLSSEIFKPKMLCFCCCTITSNFSVIQPDIYVVCFGMWTGIIIKFYGFEWFSLTISVLKVQWCSSGFSVSLLDINGPNSPENFVILYLFEQKGLFGDTILYSLLYKPECHVLSKCVNMTSSPV